MALFNEILVGRFNRGLQKLTMAKGQAPAPQLAAEIMAVIPLPLGTEYRYLDSWGRFAVHLEQAAVAAQTSAIRFRNPTNSNVIAVIEKLRLNTNPAGFVNVTGAAGAADLGTVSNGNSFFDSRGNVQSVVICSRANNVADLATLFLTETTSAVSVNVDSIIHYAQEFVISPGNTLELNTRTVNSTLLVDIVWRERFLEEAERI